MTHSMKRRSPGNNYRDPGFYHITINVYDRKKQSLGRIIGDLQCPDGHPNAPRVDLTAIGKMVEHELLHSITRHYPVIEIQDYVVMPEHMHFIVNVKNSLISKNGRQTHLGQVIAGFKEGCNRSYWEITGQGEVAAKPQPTTSALKPQPTTSAPKPQPTTNVPIPFVAGGFATSAPASGAKKLRYSSDCQPLFASGYVDVIPLKPGQQEMQRAYIHANPRNRLLRINHPNMLKPQRQAIDTLVTPNALRGYLIREHALPKNDAQMWQAINDRLQIINYHIVCDSYGNLQLLDHQLLPVVCHRKDKLSFAQHKQACLNAAANGAVLVSARIALGEQEIIDETIARLHSVVLIVDNGFPEIYHPSEARLQLCTANRLLIVTPWTYQYRPTNEEITVAQCKAMNCIVQAICHMKDDWWKK